MRGASLAGWAAIVWPPKKLGSPTRLRYVPTLHSVSEAEERRRHRYGTS